MTEQLPSNELRLSDERIAKLIELWSDTTNPGSMWSDAVLALHELSSRRASDKLRSAHEPSSARRFTGVGHLEETGYIPAGSAAERERDAQPPAEREQFNPPWRAEGFAIYDRSNNLVVHVGITGNRSFSGQKLERMAQMIADVVNRAAQPPGANVNHLRYDVRGWVCSICHGFNAHDGVVCRYPHSASTKEAKP
jgi:hypothetical protein